LSGTFSSQDVACRIPGFDIFIQEVIYEIIHQTPVRTVRAVDLGHLRKLQLGDRERVKIPEKPVERNVVTIVGVKSSGTNKLNRLEWEIDLSETKDRKPEYSAQEQRESAASDSLMLRLSDSFVKNWIPFLITTADYEEGFTMSRLWHFGPVPVISIPQGYWGLLPGEQNASS